MYHLRIEKLYNYTIKCKNESNFGSCARHTRPRVCVWECLRVCDAIAVLHVLHSFTHCRERLRRGPNSDWLHPMIEGCRNLACRHRTFWGANPCGCVRGHVFFCSYISYFTRSYWSIMRVISWSIHGQYGDSNSSCSRMEDNLLCNLFCFYFYIKRWQRYKCNLETITTWTLWLSLFVKAQLYNNIILFVVE